jgi:hypothetical protein
MALSRWSLSAHTGKKGGTAEEVFRPSEDERSLFVLAVKLILSTLFACHRPKYLTASRVLDLNRK